MMNLVMLFSLQTLSSTTEGSTVEGAGAAEVMAS